MAKWNEEIGAGLGCLAIVMLFAAVPVQASVVVTLWRWFVVPLGAPSVSFWHAAGLAALVNYLIPLPKADGEPVTREAMVEGAWRFLLKPLIAVGLGALAHWGMR